MSKAELSLRAASRLIEPLSTAVAAAMGLFRRTAHRRELAALSDRQLRDAGIDLALAGRSKAAVVSGAALRELQGLSGG
jgi:uncharacterized protein YjiS (DUF1127 family)